MKRARTGFDFAQLLPVVVATSFAAVLTLLLTLGIQRASQLQSASAALQLASELRSLPQYFGTELRGRRAASSALTASKRQARTASLAASSKISGGVDCTTRMSRVCPSGVRPNSTVTEPSIPARSAAAGYFGAVRFLAFGIFGGGAAATCAASCCAC